MTDISSELRQWVDQQWPDLAFNDFAAKPDFDVYELASVAPNWQALHGDAGFRRYFRLASEPPLLAVYAPPQTEDTALFISLAQLLRRHGVLAPAIAAADPAKGFLLVEDLGSTLLLNELTDESSAILYEEAMGCLQHIQSIDVKQLALPQYDQSALRAEMALFPQWFVGKLLGRDVSVAEQNILDELFAALESSALEQPKVLVHRDFHSRNLVYRPDGPPGVIDFQDAVIGPVTYDLVSLLRDCYIAWPSSQVCAWALSYLAKQQGLQKLCDVSEETFIRWFDWMGLQRHIKVLGIFARLSLRDGKHGYLNDLPLVIRYTLDVARNYREFEPFVSWFEQEILPQARQQAWWNDQVIA